ncbi:MAG: regulator [Lawsonibacter sp.]|nr:regulator [Lawsonibacter sp.]
MVETVYTPNAPVSKFPISQATKVGNLYFLSGQTGVDPVSGQLVGETIEQQAEQTMRNIGAILESEGLDFTDVARVTCYMSDMRNTPRFNAVFERYFISRPARSCFAVQELPRNCLCELEVIAAAK